MNQKVGHLISFHYDPENLIFWMSFNNKSLGLKFNKLEYASSVWRDMEYTFKKKYTKALEDDLFSLSEI